MLWIVNLSRKTWPESFPKLVLQVRSKFIPLRVRWTPNYMPWYKDSLVNVRMGTECVFTTFTTTPSSLTSGSWFFRPNASQNPVLTLLRVWLRCVELQKRKQMHKKRFLRRILSILYYKCGLWQSYLFVLLSQVKKKAPKKSNLCRRPSMPSRITSESRDSKSVPSYNLQGRIS